MRFVNWLNLPTNLLVILILAMTYVLFTSCASIPDVMVCTEINMTKGFCTRTVSDEDVIIDDTHPYAFGDAKPTTWWEMRPFMVLVPIQSWVEIKAYIIKNCKQNNCSSHVKSWDRKIKELDERVKNQ